MSDSWYALDSFNISGFEEGNFLGDKGGFVELIDSFMGKAVQIYGDRISNTPVTVRALIQNVTSDMLTNADQRQILTEIGELQCGQYIKFDNRYWLVISLVDNNMVYEKAIIWYCNYTVKFLSPKAVLGSTTVDAISALGQKILNVISTVNFTAGETVLIGFPANYEVGVINTIQAGVSLTLVANLTKTHSIAETVATAQEEVSYPVVSNKAVQNNSGVESNNTMAIGSTQRLLFVPYNDETIGVDRDFRLLVDRRTSKPTAYKVTQVDTEQYDYDGYGVLRWTLTEDVLRSTDDIAKMIADTTSTGEIDSELAGGGWLDVEGGGT